MFYGAFLVICMAFGGMLAAGALSKYLGEEYAFLGLLVPIFAVVLFFLGSITWR